MAFSTVFSASIEGLSVEMVRVEADISNGLPLLHMVGFLSTEVKEAGERVRTAIKNTGITIPAKRIIINLAPGTIKKRGSSFDLPIAVSLLNALGLFPQQQLEQTLVIGELGLDGSVKKIPGVLPLVMAAKDAGLTRCIVPKENEKEASLVRDITIYGVEHLSSILDFFKGNTLLKQTPPYESFSSQEAAHVSHLDFSDIYGQETLKRAAEVAVAGGHNFLMIGPPGSGKSMIASRIPSILPPPSSDICTEITKIYSVLGLIDPNHPLIIERPFRSVHHTVSKPALIGGGMIPKPGEISLAHHGVLFLDELAEFPKPVLEVLRQPLEDHKIHITRSQGNYIFPADFMLVAAMNPCPCGNYPDYERCHCSPWQINQYISKISQPFLDRIDICIDVPKVEYRALKETTPGESSAEIRERILSARNIQQNRYQHLPFKYNARLRSRDFPIYCALDYDCERLMQQAYDLYNLTARTYHKILKVARTIADLESSPNIQLSHLKEALSYRNVDKKYWER